MAFTRTSATKASLALRETAIASDTRMMESRERLPSLPPRQRWGLVSRHGFVLFFLAMSPNSTMRELSMSSGLTERTLYNIIKDLIGAEMVTVTRVGRMNSYAVNPDAHFIHPMFSHLRLGKFLDLLKPPPGESND